VHVLRAGKGARPWYVGKAELQSFKAECFTDNKIKKYAFAEETQKGTPLLYFYARVTAGKKVFSKPSKSSHKDIPYLEKLLIASALRRNPKLINIKDTDLLKKLCVPGLLNGQQGALDRSAREIRKILDY
jgi:hypothetical protein